MTVPRKSKHKSTPTALCSPSLFQLLHTHFLPASTRTRLARQLQLATTPPPKPLAEHEIHWVTLHFYLLVWSGNASAAVTEQVGVQEPETEPNLRSKRLPLSVISRLRSEVICIHPSLWRFPLCFDSCSGHSLPDGRCARSHGNEMTWMISESAYFLIFHARAAV